MPANQITFLAVGEPVTRDSLAAGLDDLGLPYSVPDRLPSTAEALLADNPAVVLFDTGALIQLNDLERQKLCGSDVQVLLAYHRERTGRNLAALSSIVSDFLELPVDRERLATQVKRAVEIAELKQNLSRLMEAREGNSRKFDRLIEERARELTEAEHRACIFQEHVADIERLKSNLITIISHEFKTPLHLAGGYAELMKDGSLGVLNNEQHAATETICRNISRLTIKLQDIERIAQLEMGLSKDLTEDIELGRLLQREIDGFRDSFAEKQLVVSLDIDGKLPTIHGSNDLLTDVFRRLIDNAVHYTGLGGKIEVRIAASCDDRSRQGVLVRVADTGCGVPAKQLPYLFDRFGEFRDIEHHSSGNSGLGLGLPICRHIVEMHGGAIDATSVPGEGCVFSVFLPLGN